MASFEGFKKELMEVKPGDRLVYHIGNLGEDRSRQSTVHKTALLCTGLHLAGYGKLTQQRLDATRTVYYFTLHANPARTLHGADITRAWTAGQESWTAL